VRGAAAGPEVDLADRHRRERGVRERRADDAYGNDPCAHRAYWIEEAHVTELTSPLREGLHGDQLAGWLTAMGVFVRREQPHPGALLSLFEADDGWRYCGTGCCMPWPGWPTAAGSGN